MRILFLGTPTFAVASLKALVEAGKQVVGVVTAPDKPAGRGMKMTASAVKEYAVQQGLTVIQPPRLKDAKFIEELKELKPDLGVVVAFRMLPEAVWSLPPMGTINVHGSLLPQYRGAAPIHWAVINGEKETGVTTFLLKQEIDTGDVLLQASLPIHPTETTGEVHDRMMVAGAQLLLRSIDDLANGSVQPKPQETLAIGEAIRHAPKIFPADCAINFTLPVEQVHNFVRGLSPFPGAFTHLNGQVLKIFRAEAIHGKPLIPAGEFERIDNSALRMACADGALNILELQMQGKKKLMVGEFLRGWRG